MTAQNQFIEGGVVNRTTQSGISGVHIFTEDQKVGSVSNQKGDFKIYISEMYSGKYLYFSQIGFAKDSVLISEMNKSVFVSLVPKSYELKEIYVIPDSTLLTLLRKAYSRIPENYPTAPTLYEGFYRESSQNNNVEQADFIEAHLSIYKDRYDKPSADPGKVELLRSRKRKIKNTGILYYGGPFLPISSDVVLQRDNFINPRHFKKYNYEFNGIKALGDQEFYEIAFSSAAKDSIHLNGTILIEKESLAYVSFDLKSTTNISHPRIEKRVSHSKINYEKIEDKWYYKTYTAASEDFFRYSDKKIYGKVDYITTHVQTDSVKSIPYARQLSFFEPFVLKAEEYDHKGWIDYDLLRSNEMDIPVFQFSVAESEEIFSRKPSSERRSANFLLKLASVIDKTYMDFGIAYSPVVLEATQHNIKFSPSQNSNTFSINKIQRKETQYPLIYSSIGYRLNKNISVVYEASGDLFNKNISSAEYRLGIAYLQNLTNTGRLFFIEGSLMGSLRNNYVSLGKYDNPTTFRIEGKKIDANKISFWYGTQQHAITPQIALKRNTSKFFSLKVFIAYNIEINSKDVFRIKEEKGGLFQRKTAIIKAENPALAFDNANERPWNSLITPGWQAGVALVFN